MRISTFLICLCLHFASFSQLNGAYTVGQVGDNYPEIDSAMYALQQQGVSGPVTFLVSDGEYGMLDLAGFNPLSGDSLVIRSASGNPELARFSGAKLYQVHNVTLLDLGFYKAMPDELSLVRATLCYLLKIKGCILEDNLNTNYDYDESTLRIEHAYDLPLTRVFVDSCHISSLDAQNHTPNEYVVYESGVSGRTYYTSDTILGGWRNNSYYREYVNCYLEADEGLDAAGNGLFQHCDINFLDFTNKEIRGGIIDSCHIYGAHSLRVAVDSLVNSLFDIPVNLDGYDTKVINNLFHKSFHSSVYSGFIGRNVFFDYTDISETPVSVNNFFLDTTQMQGSVYHNNFGPNSHLLYYGFGSVQQNNIHGFTGNGPNLSMFGNNFSATDKETLNHAFSDANPTFYDPQYVGTDDLHIQNPALFSRGFEVSFLATHDFDDELRSPSMTSIGADEVCLQLPLRDTLFVQCGTAYALKSCASLDGLHWEPTSVIGGTADAPTVLVDEVRLVWLEDASGNHIDSMYLSPLPVFGSGKRTFEVNCGQWGFYATHVPQGGTLSWEPESAVNNPLSHQVTITPDTNMLVIAHVDLGVCGVKSDTLEFIVDPTPIAHILPDSLICNTMYFNPYLLCYDSLLWNFGDGTTSADETMNMHTYPSAGNYTMSLTSWHEGLSTTVTYPVYSFCVGIDEHALENFKLYPNPANEVLNVDFESKKPVDYQVLDQSGRVLMEGIISEDQPSVDVVKLSKGLYYFSFGGQGKLFLKR